MGWKRDSTRKTPSVKVFTSLDIHMALSIQLVVFQAIRQTVTSSSYGEIYLLRVDSVLQVLSSLYIVIINVRILVEEKILLQLHVFIPQDEGYM